MLDLCTGSSVGKAKLDRTAKTRTRRVNEAARAQQVGGCDLRSTPSHLSRGRIVSLKSPNSTPDRPHIL